MTAPEDAAARQAAGRWLRETRLRLGFETVGELARALGVDPSRVSNYETGKSRVPDDRADQLAELFKMDVIEVRRNLRLWVPPPDDTPADEPANLEPLIERATALFSEGMELLEQLRREKKRGA